MIESLLASSGVILFSLLAGLLAHAAYRQWRDGSSRASPTLSNVSVDDKTTHTLATLQAKYAQLQADQRAQEQHLQTTQQEVAVAEQKTVVSKNFLHDLAASIDAIKNRVDDLRELQFEDAGQEASFQQMYGRLRTEISFIANDTRDMKRFLEDFGHDVKLKLGRCDVKKLCEDVREARTTTASQRGVQLWVTCHAKALPKVAVDADSLRRVITNLVDNGIKYADRDYAQRGKEKPPYVGIELSVQLEPRMVLIKVCDNGIGMRSEHIGSLWSDTILTPEQRQLQILGSGLGLAVVKLYLDAHKSAGIHAEISVESAEGKGTIFTIKLPFEKEE